jgi:hypothetical protein
MTACRPEFGYEHGLSTTRDAHLFSSGRPFGLDDPLFDGPKVPDKPASVFSLTQLNRLGFWSRPSTAWSGEVLRSVAQRRSWLCWYFWHISPGGFSSQKARSSPSN